MHVLCVVTKQHQQSVAYVGLIPPWWIIWLVNNVKQSVSVVCCGRSHEHTRVAGSTFHLPFSHAALILPAGANPGSHLRNISVVHWWVSKEPFSGVVGSLQLAVTGKSLGRSMVYNFKIRIQGRGHRYEVIKPVFQCWVWVANSCVLYLFIHFPLFMLHNIQISLFLTWGKQF